MRAFSKHRVSADFLEPGGVDLTADVDFTSLALDAREAGFVPLAFMEMGTFLMMGVEKIVGAAPCGRPQSGVDSKSTNPNSSSADFGRPQGAAPTGTRTSSDYSASRRRGNGSEIGTGA